MGGQTSSGVGNVFLLPVNFNKKQFNLYSISMDIVLLVLPESLGEGVSESLKTILPCVSGVAVKTAAQFFFENLNDDAADLLQ